jgi:hypothetical protein
MKKPTEKSRSGTTIPHAIREARGRRVDLFLPSDLAERVDAARGAEPLATWIRAAVERACTSDCAGARARERERRA